MSRHRLRRGRIRWLGPGIPKVDASCHTNTRFHILYSMAKKRGFRSAQNILVTGTPGTGKTTFSNLLAAAISFRLVNVGDRVKEDGLHNGWDEEHQCYTLDEDKARNEGICSDNTCYMRTAYLHLATCGVCAENPEDTTNIVIDQAAVVNQLLHLSQVCDALETQMSEGGNVVDFHTCDFFPER